MLTKNKIVHGVIEGYTAEGLGIARIDGQVVFVHNAVQGEECDILILKVLKNIAFGKVKTLYTTSSERREPECPYYAKCGGCSYWHMSYEEELRAKKQRVQDALTRIGGSAVVVEEIYGAKNPYHYRNKTQYPISKDGAVGFYRERTHEVTDIHGCLIQKKSADRAAEAVREYIHEYQVPCYDEIEKKGLLRHLYVRSNCKGESLICLLCNGTKLPKEAELVEKLRAKCPEVVGIVLGINKKPGNVILGDSYRTLWGCNTISDTLCGLTFDLSVPSFYQVNHDQAEVLYEKALEFVNYTGNELAIDLYCGAGTITQLIARHAGRVIGAEIVPEAIEDANKSAQRNQVNNVEFFCGDAKDIAQNLVNNGLRPDVISVDPPRKGLAPQVIEAIVNMSPEKICYVSCDPATLARDVKIFEKEGYFAIRAAAVDLFPRTQHIETVCLLVNQNVKAKQHVNVGIDAEEYYRIKNN